eukprot:gene12171-4469_t
MFEIAWHGMDGNGDFFPLPLPIGPVARTLLLLSRAFFSSGLYGSARVLNDWYKDVKKLDCEMAESSAKLETFKVLPQKAETLAQIAVILEQLDARCQLKSIRKASSRLSKGKDGATAYADDIREALAVLQSHAEAEPPTITKELITKAVLAIDNHKQVNEDAKAARLANGGDSGGGGAAAAAAAAAPAYNAPGYVSGVHHQMVPVTPGAPHGIEDQDAASSLMNLTGVALQQYQQQQQQQQQQQASMKAESESKDGDVDASSAKNAVNAGAARSAAETEAETGEGNDANTITISSAFKPGAVVVEGGGATPAAAPLSAMDAMDAAAAVAPSS